MAEGNAFSQNVSELTAPGIDGEIGLLPGHVALLAAIVTGTVAIKPTGSSAGDEPLMYAIAHGVLEVANDKALLLTDKFSKKEDVDVVAVSIMTSGHLHVAEHLVPALKAKGMNDVLVIFGGIIPDVDFEPLQKMGVHRAFPAGLPGSVVVDYINANVGKVGL